MSPPRASSQRTAVHCGPRYATGQQELPLRKAACTGLGHWRDSGGVQHTLREMEGVSLLKAFPAWQLAWWGKNGPVAGIKGWTDPGSGSPFIPAPSRGAQNRMQANEQRQEQGPSHTTVPGRFPHLPLAPAPGRAPSSNGAGEGPCPFCLAPPVQLQVPPVTSARSTLNVESQPQEPAVTQLLSQC